MEQKRIPLYETFGKFMGKPAQRGSDNFIEIIKRAKQQGLRARFMHANDSTDDIGDNHKRINIIANEQTQAIQEITIG